MPHAHDQSPASKPHEYWAVASVRFPAFTFDTHPTNQRNPTPEAAKTALTSAQVHINMLFCSASALAALSSSSSSSSSRHLLSARRITATRCGSLSACSPEISTETDPDDLDDDDLDEDEDGVPIAFRMLTQQTRWAPASRAGSRFAQRDSDGSRAVNELLAQQAPLPFDRDAPLPLPVRALSRLGEGRFGDVLLCENAEGERIAVKVALREAAALSGEATALDMLRGVAGFPAMLHHQPARGGHSALLAMELLGPSLQSVQETRWRRERPSEQTVLGVGCGMLRRLRALHGAGLVHNDLKPANILLGAPGAARARAPPS